MQNLIFDIKSHLLANYLQWLLVPLIFIIGYGVLRLVDRHIARFFDRVEYDRTLEVLVQKTLNAFLWIVVVTLALSNVGFDVSGFIAGLGVMGFIVGFAVKDVLSNVAAGLFLLVKRPFNVGETIQVVGVTGIVETMTLSSCLVITEEQDHVTLPNAKIWGNAIRNKSRGRSEYEASAETQEGP